MTTFKAMTWNVENLFRSPMGAEETDQQRYERKLGLLARVIKGLSSDVVALQEVGGGEEPLQDLQEALGGAYTQRAVSVFPDSRDIQVAFLSKHAIAERTDLVDFPPARHSRSASSPQRMIRGQSPAWAPAP